MLATEPPRRGFCYNQLTDYEVCSFDILKTDQKQNVSAQVKLRGPCSLTFSPGMAYIIHIGIPKFEERHKKKKLNQRCLRHLFLPCTLMFVLKTSLHPRNTSILFWSEIFSSDLSYALFSDTVLHQVTPKMNHAGFTT